MKLRWSQSTFKIMLFVVAATLVGPTAVDAGDKVKSPESFLSADTLAFFRFDGMERQRAAYDKTVLAKLMREDLGEFLDYVGPQLVNGILNEGPFFPILRGRAPDEKIQEEIMKAVRHLLHHGIVIGIETPEKGAVKIKGRRDLFDLEGVQVTIVFPEGGLPKNRAILEPFLRKLAKLSELEVTEKKLRKRSVQFAELPGFHGAWWVEDTHLVLALGTLALDRTVDVIEGRLPNVTSVPLHQATTGFDRYPTNMRGHVDLEKLVDILKTPPETGNRFEMIKEAIKRQVVLNQLGLTGLKSASFQLGFDGPYQRRTVTVNVAEPKDRPGFMKLVTGPLLPGTESGAKGSLPNIPPDVSSVRVHHVDWQKVDEVCTQLAGLQNLATTFREVPDFRGQLLQPLFALKYDFRQGILPALDSQLVAYNAFSEGPWIVGQVVAIKVKDAAKLQTGLDGLNQALIRALDIQDRKDGFEDKGKEGECAAQAGRRVGFRKQSYRGADLYVWEGNQRFQDIFGIPLTYTIHKGWLVMSPFPQAVKGYIMRSDGNYQVWKTPPMTAQALDLAKKAGGPQSKLVAIHVSDPKPTVEIALALMPTIMHLTGAFAWRGGEQERFDVAKIPNAQSVTEPLLPNVSVVYDDGSALRWESHSSLHVPLEEWFFVAAFVGMLL